MTVEELRGQMLVERYADTIRAAEAMVTWATPWTKAEQRRHLAELDEAIRDHDAGLRLVRGVA